MRDPGDHEGPSVLVVGTGIALPPRVRSNDHYAAYLDTSDDWIRGRTGIVERHIGGTTAGLAAEAGRAAIADAGVDPKDIGLCLLATTTPDRQIPPTSAVVHRELGLACGALDLNAACSGFVYALTLAATLTRTFEPILIIGSEVLTRVTDPYDRPTAVLMADGAGAVVVRRGRGGRGDVWTDLGVDGTLDSLLFAEHGGCMQMNGREVFRHAVRSSAASCERVFAAAGVVADDIALFVPHQANLRIIEAIASRLGISAERCAISVDTTGNTSAASVPIALAAATRAGRANSGDLVLFAGFGAGMTWASALVRW